jgi:hypothetical protein
MHGQPQEPGHGPDHTSLRAGRLWATAAAVATLGAWVMFDARPGLNWLLWTGAAATGLTALHRDRHAQRSGYVVPSLGVTATSIAGAAAVTASALLQVAIFASVVILLAMQMLLAADPSLRRVTARFAATAPPVALLRAVPHALRRAAQATEHIRSPRARAWVRGLALTLPVLFVFALLLAEADPTFARWRDTLDAFFSTWEFLPRVIFFTALLGLVVGAYGYAITEAAPPGLYSGHPDWISYRENSCPDGTSLISVTRGGIVTEGGLRDASVAGRIGGAVVQLPPPRWSRLYRTPALELTHYAAANSPHRLERAHERFFQGLATLLETGSPPARVA